MMQKRSERLQATTHELRAKIKFTLDLIMTLPYFKKHQVFDLIDLIKADMREISGECFSPHFYFW